MFCCFSWPLVGRLSGVNDPHVGNWLFVGGVCDILKAGICIPCPRHSERHEGYLVVVTLEA